MGTIISDTAHDDRRIVPARKILSALLAGCLASSSALANPTGAQIVNGQVSISRTGNTLTVTNSPNAIVNWQGFSINPGELTQFLQQSAGSSILNRVVGQDPSQILGALQSNGRVYLINPNGILFGAGSRIDVGGLIASSLDIGNRDFLAGKLNFLGQQAGAVTNQGNITTPSGGQIYLIAPQVENSGVITSPQGEVLLAAGHKVQLVDGADPNIQVVISSPSDQAVNLGKVIAQSGKIGIYGALVNQRGTVSANSAVVGANGKIVFKATGTTTLSDDSRTTVIGAGTGGEIDVLGDKVVLTDTAKLIASGKIGGGTILVGGDRGGLNPAIQNATTINVGAHTAIKADAIQSGNGGKVILWSNDATSAYGVISARGGASGGDGGFVETSGHYLDANGISVNASAPKGANGTWLLDPYDITIGTATDTSTNSGTNPITYTGTTSGSQLLASTVAAALTAGTSVVVDTTGAGSDQGDITVASAINASPSSTASLTLNATHNVTVNAPIAANGGDVIVNAGNSFTMTSVVGGGGTITEAGSISAANLAISAGSDVTINAPITVSGTVALLTTTGSIAQSTSAPGPITATAVSAVATTGSVQLNDFGNAFGTIAGGAGGFLGFSVEDNVSFTVGDVATVGSIPAVSGISTTVGTLALQTPSVGDITFAAPVNAGTGSVSIDAAGALLQGSGGSITAANATLISLSSTGIGTGDVGTGGPLLTNFGTLTRAEAFGTTVPGALYIQNDSSALSLGVISAVGAVQIGTTGTLTIPTGSGEGSPSVTASAVTLVSQGDMTIAARAGGGNIITASTGGTINLRAGFDSSGTAIAASALTAGFDSSDAAIAASALTVTGNLSAPSGAINLTAGGTVTNTGTSLPTPTVNSSQFVGSAPTLSACIADPTLSGCSSVLPSLSACITAPSTTGCSVVLPTLAACISSPSTSGCTVVLPTLSACISAPSTTGCSAVLPTLSACISAPSTTGCSAVLPTLSACISAPSTTGCSAVLPTLSACISAPSTTGCSAVLPTLSACISAPSTTGCSAVLPTLAACISAPSTTGCSAVLPTLSACISAPSTTGCSAVLPTLAACIASPSTPGCSVLLPTLAACIAAPSTAGCSSVLPSLASCVTNPSAAGCTVVLPTLAQCTINPTAAGCAVVLPTVATCVTNPSAVGCTAVLPSIASCTATPTLAGCSAVLPTIAQCTFSPTLAGCSAVLPTLAVCVSSPTTAGCTTVLPSIGTCEDSPTTSGCAAVLPSLAACVATPTNAGCTAVLPSLASCTANPTQAGCSAVLPTLATCVANPGAAGCTTVLPSLATCSASPTLTGCSVVLPSLASCLANSAQTGCTPVLAAGAPPPTLTPPPSADICTIAPNSALCQVLSPPTASQPVKPVQQAANEVIKTVTTSAPLANPSFNQTIPPSPSSSSGSSSSTGATATTGTSSTPDDSKSDKTSDKTDSKEVASTDKSGTKNEPAKKTYCN